MSEQPEIQLIANLVVERDGRILFVRYHADDERWWLPGEDLEPYEHPDERAAEALRALGLEPTSLALAYVDSFRGRRGWHVVFNYRVAADGEPSDAYETAWYQPDDLPRTMHGRWEHEQVRRVLDSTPPAVGTLDT